MISSKESSLDVVSEYINSKKINYFIQELLDYGSTSNSNSNSTYISFSTIKNKLCINDCSNCCIFMFRIELPVDMIEYYQEVDLDLLKFEYYSYLNDVEGSYNHISFEEYVLYIYSDFDSEGIEKINNNFYLVNSISLKEFEDSIKNNEIKNIFKYKILKFNRKTEKKNIKEKIINSLNEQISQVSTYILEDNKYELFKLINNNRVDTSIFNDQEILKYYLYDDIKIPLPKDSIVYLLDNNFNIYELFSKKDCEPKNINELIDFLRVLNNENLFKIGSNFIKDYYDNKYNNSYSIIEFMKLIINKFDYKIKKDYELLKYLEKIIKYNAEFYPNDVFNRIFITEYDYILKNMSIKLDPLIIPDDEIWKFICNSSSVIYKDIFIDVKAINFIDLFFDRIEKTLNTKNKYLISEKTMDDLNKLNNIYDNLINFDGFPDVKKASIDLEYSSNAIKLILKNVNVLKDNY